MQNRTIVQTKMGKIQGYYENGLCIFKGVPYATPPTGKLRWHPPRPHSPWTGIRDARDFGPAAPQPPSKAGSIKEFVVEGPQSEDCLYLNIWTPGLDNNRRPVMVWIHGGYFTMGAGSQASFEGDILAGHCDVLVITINYRLGALGFLNLNEVTRGLIPATGNEGLLDQIAALEWVRDNAAAFGGDPGNVTIFGESAGGTSIECLMAMPRARGLFHKAILQSPMGKAVKPLKDALEVSEQWLQRSGLKGENFPDLLDLPLEKLLEAQKEVSVKFSGKALPFAPVITGQHLHKMPLEALRKGAAAGIPIMVGTNRDEMQLFSALYPHSKINEAELRQRAAQLVGNLDIDQVIQSYQTSLTAKGKNMTPAAVLEAIQTDFMFRIPAMELLKARCQNREPAFAYLFIWNSPVRGGIFGACHGLEIGFIFGKHDAGFCGTGPLADRLSFQMQHAWTAFARTGSPKHPGQDEWPQYCVEHKPVLLGDL